MCGPEEAVRVCITRCMLREDRGRCPGTWQEAGRILGEEHGDCGFYLQWGDVGGRRYLNCRT